MAPVLRALWGRWPEKVIVTYLIVAILAALVALTGLGGESLFARLHTGQASYPGASSYVGEQILAHENRQDYVITAIVTVPELKKNSEDVANSLKVMHHDLKNTPEIKSIVDPFTPFDPQLKEGQKLAGELKRATEKAQDIAANEARKKAISLGADEADINNVEQQARAIAAEKVREASPKPWKVIQDSDLKKLISEKHNTFLVIVTIEAKDQHYAKSEATRQRVVQILRTIPEYLSDINHVKVHVTDDELLRKDINKQIESDLRVGEGVSVPLALIIMAVAFSGFLSALLPLTGAGVTISIALFILFLISYGTDLQSFVVNVVTFLALGLSIDYGLLIVSRYREELISSQIMPERGALPYFLPRALQKLMLAHSDTTPQVLTPQIKDGTYETLSFNHPELTAKHYWLNKTEYQKLKYSSRQPYLSALIRTMNSAGMTVLYSAAIVALAITGLLIFPQPILSSMGVGGVTAVLLALLINWTLLPALLVVLGPFIITKRNRKIPQGLTGLLDRIRRSKLHRNAARPPRGTSQHVTQTGAVIDGKLTVPIRCALFSSRHPIAVLVITLTMLVTLAIPAFSLHMRFSWVEALPPKIPQIQVLNKLWTQYPHTKPADLTIISEAPTTELKKWSDEKLKPMSAIKIIDNPEPLKDGKFPDCQQKPCPVGKSVIKIHASDTDSASTANQKLVEKLRETSAPFKFWVTGPAAIQVDFNDTLLHYAPYVLAFICLSTMLMIFLMTKSVVLPLQAIMVNGLSLLSSLGIATMIFEFGWGQHYLDFTSLGALESYVVAIVLCFGFGLSMDYEMFLLSRVQEVWNRTRNNHRSVDEGMAGSASIITSAALILLVVFSGFAVSDMLAIKEIGLTLTLAVAIDATVVRLFLVPSLMTVMGSLNWYCPKPLYRLVKNLNLHEDR